MRREKSLRIGVHHANAVVWGPVYRTHHSQRLDDDPRDAPSDDVRGFLLRVTVGARAFAFATLLLLLLLVVVVVVPLVEVLERRRRRADVQRLAPLHVPPASRRASAARFPQRPRQQVAVAAPRERAREAADRRRRGRRDVRAGVAERRHRQRREVADDGVWRHGPRARRQRSERFTPPVRLQSFSGSSSSASFAAPGAAVGHAIASRRKTPTASPRVTLSGERSKPRTPGARTPITAAPSDASEAAACFSALAAVASRPTIASSSSSSSSSDSSSSDSSPSDPDPSLPVTFRRASSSSSTAASRNRSSAADAACLSAMSDPLSSCSMWCKMGTTAAGGHDENQRASSSAPSTAFLASAWRFLNIGAATLAATSRAATEVNAATSARRAVRVRRRPNSGASAARWRFAAAAAAASKRVSSSSRPEVFLSDVDEFFSADRRGAGGTTAASACSTSAIALSSSLRTESTGTSVSAIAADAAARPSSGPRRFRSASSRPAAPPADALAARADG
eukprot:29468-Pelagococcus_subviridis.AAC.2